MSESYENKKYEPFKIPSLKTEWGGGYVPPPGKTGAPSLSSLSDGVFYEIDYDSGPVPGVGKFVAKPQSVKKPENDDIRGLFGQMREISRARRSTYDFSRFFDRRVQSDNAETFFRQGRFMKDFTDSYEENAQFSQYFPCYQMMGYEQLRTYFTWRTEVRKGNVSEISLSYAFLYVYELLSNIGADSPQDGLDKLLFFKKSFGGYNNSLDRYIIRWLKDYHIYYELPHTFKEFAEENGLSEHYGEISETYGGFDMFCAVSKYDIRKSKFFTDETSLMIKDCFSYVIERIRRDFKVAGISFDDALFRTAKKAVQWKPFKDALFYNWLKGPDRRVILSENEMYSRINNEWSFSPAITSEKGRRFIGYVMKRMESELRSVKNYKYKLTADISMISEETLRVLTKAGIYTDRIVPEAVAAFHREATKTVVTVDSFALDRIRREALITQEALIVEEKDAPAFETSSAENQKVFEDAPETGFSQVPDVWESLKNILSETELLALCAMSRGEDLRAFAAQSGVMPEVIADGINEKAYDCIGDGLMDEDFVLFSEYAEQIKELTAKKNSGQAFCHNG